MKFAIEVLVEDNRWRRLRGVVRSASEAAELALKRGTRGRSRGSVTILLSGDARARKLNARFRGKDKPTNVLSFAPAISDGTHLGDVVIAYGVTAREARASNKHLRDHLRHLVVHGVLHLLGYDHERPREAQKMERLEVSVLAELGIAHPYRSGAKRA